MPRAAFVPDHQQLRIIFAIYSHYLQNNRTQKFVEECCQDFLGKKLSFRIVDRIIRNSVQPGQDILINK